MATASPPESQPRGTITVNTRTKKGHKAAFSCTECNAEFNRAAHLRRHQRAHQGEKPYSCAYCSLSSSRKDVIVRHTRNFHPDIVSKRAGDGAPTPAHEDGDAAHTLSSPSSTPDSHNAGNIQTQLVQIHPSDDQNGLHDVFPHPNLPNLHFPELGLFRGENSGSLEASLTEDLVVDVFPPTDPTSSDLWDMLLASVPDITPGASNHAPSNLQALPVELPLSPEQERQQTKAIFSLDAAGYEQARRNLASYDSGQRLLDFQFPTRYAVIRYVKAYHEYMDPQLPVVHQPTFNAATVSSPLLLEMMACGAMYLNEREPAVRIHAITLQLSSQHWQTDGPFQLWPLQTNILMGFFETYAAEWVTPPRVASIISSTVKMAQEAVEAMKMLKVTTYQDCVCKESVNRCMVSAIVLGAALNSTSGKRYFTLPTSESKFSLPETTSMWQRKEEDALWQEHRDLANFHDILKMIIAGQTPAQEIEDFGFLSLVSAVLDHICSFETLAGSQHPHLYRIFVKEMVKSVEVLDRMWPIRAVREATHMPMNTPMIRSAKSLLDSAYYHLYAYHQLTAMKGLLCAPETLGRLSVIHELFKEPPDSSDLGKALTRAAEVLREDCRQGLKYLQRVGPHRFAPLTTTAAFEGGLLLCWYLRTRRSVSPVPDSQTTIDQLITEAASEVTAVQGKVVDNLTLFPLKANAEILRDNSVWTWPPAVSSKLSCLAQYLEGVL